jgi:hypothetical protein
MLVSICALIFSFSNMLISILCHQNLKYDHIIFAYDLSTYKRLYISHRQKRYLWAVRALKKA